MNRHPIKHYSKNPFVYDLCTKCLYGSCFYMIVSEYYRFDI